MRAARRCDRALLYVRAGLGAHIGIIPDIALGNSLAPNRKRPHRILQPSDLREAGNAPAGSPYRLIHGAQLQTNGLDLLSTSLGLMRGHFRFACGHAVALLPGGTKSSVISSRRALPAWRGLPRFYGG